jgi:hypothetical protein
MLQTLLIKHACKCLAKLWTLGGEGEKFGAEWNGNDMQLDAFSAL